MRKPFLVLGICLALLCVSARQAHAQFVTTDPPLEATTLLMRAQQVMQYIKEAQTAVNALQMANIMVQDAKNLIEHPTTNIASTLANLSGILTASQGLAGDMAQMDVGFRQMYGVYNGPDAATSFALKYNNWATTSLNTIHGTLNAAGYQSSLLQNEQLWMQKVQTMNQTAVGRDQMIQLGNVIAMEEVGQMEKLRQLMIADMSSKAAFAAQQISAQQSEQNAQQSGFTHANWAADQRIW